LAEALLPHHTPPPHSARMTTTNALVIAIRRWVSTVAPTMATSPTERNTSMPSRK
jgi:hypothetical protein